MTRFALLITGACTIAALLLALALPLTAQDNETEPGEAEAGEWTRERAAESFRKSCSHCHTVPDPAVHSDQLWLGQVMRTS